MKKDNKKEEELNSLLAVKKMELKQEGNRLSINKEYQKVKREIRINKNEYKILDEEIDEVTKKINDRFMNKSSWNSYPNYSRTNNYGDYGIDTNIKDEVLKAIKNVVGGISKLRVGYIEEITQEMMNKEKRDNKELKELNKKNKIGENKRNKLEEKEETFEEPLKKIEREINDIEYDIQDIGEEEIKRQKRYDERKGKKAKIELVRENALNSIDKIYENFKDELIIGNL